MADILKKMSNAITWMILLGMLKLFDPAHLETSGMSAAGVIDALNKMAFELEGISDDN